LQQVAAQITQGERTDFKLLDPEIILKQVQHRLQDDNVTFIITVRPELVEGY